MTFQMLKYMVHVLSICIFVSWGPRLASPVAQKSFTNNKKCISQTYVS